MHLRIRQTLSILLSAAVLLTCAPVTAMAVPLASDSEEGGSSKTSSAITVKRLKELAKDYDVSEEFLDEIAKKKTLTTAQLKSYANEYKLPAQYVQRFIKNSFVFKEGDKLKYYAVDTSLPKNKYNWNHLSKTAKGMKYTVDGVSKAEKVIDVSEFQGDIDWAKVKADGVKGAFIRAGYRGYGTGKIKEDSKFRQNMKGAQAAGVKIGVYFYSQAINTEEAKEEAQFTLDLIDGYKLTYPVVFDIEGAPSTSARTANLNKQNTTPIIKAFCDTVKDAGYKPMVYSYAKWIITKMDLSKLKKYDLWLAQYYQEPFFPYQFDIWQYSSKGQVNGIKGGVDMNLCFTSYR